MKYLKKFENFVHYDDPVINDTNNSQDNNDDDLPVEEKDQEIDVEPGLELRMDSWRNKHSK